MQEVRKIVDAENTRDLTIPQRALKFREKGP
jgi:hypothetical protein